MDIHFDERLALPANLRRLGDRRAFDLDQRDRLRLLRRQQGEQMVDAEPCMDRLVLRPDRGVIVAQFGLVALAAQHRSEEHTSELQSLMRISYAVFCLKKKNTVYHLLHEKKKQQKISQTNTLETNIS